MESLESKLDRLSPSQRKEVEDFVEFLLSREEAGISRNVPESRPAMNIPPPLLTPVEPACTVIPRSEGIPPTSYPENAATRSGSDEPTDSPFHEIEGGARDHPTSGYLDYGQFDSGPSPATEAVKKVRRKITEREGRDRPHQILDWVD